MLSSTRPTRLRTARAFGRGSHRRRNELAAVVARAFGLASAYHALAASVYLVYVLEIVKFRRFRERQLAKQAGITQAEIDREIDREIETGEFPAIKLD